MPTEWQKVQGGPAFRGLLRRRQMQLDDLQYFEALQNVDTYGGAIAKRAGSQLVNGYATVFTSPGNISDTVLTVRDGQGFTASQPVYIGSGTYTVIAKTATTISISPGLTAGQSINTPIVQAFPWVNTATTPPSIPNIQTLFQAVYRNGDKWQLASINSAPFVVKAGQAPYPMDRSYLPTLPPVIVRATPAPTTTSARISWGEGIKAGDWICIGAAGRDGQYARGVQVQSVAVTTGLDADITWSPAMQAAPASGDYLYYYTPTVNNSAQPPPEFVQYGNYTFMVGGLMSDTLGHGWPTTPIVFRQTGTPTPAPGATLYMNTAGIHPPTTPPLIDYYVLPDGGLLNATYKYRIRFFNSKTGQESEGGPNTTATVTGSFNAVSLFINGSPDPQVDQIHIYRTVAGGDGQWYRVQNVHLFPPSTSPLTNVIANPLTGSALQVWDVTPDTQLGEVMRDFQDNQMQTSISLLAIWGQANRLIGLDRVQNSVWYSDQPDLATGRLKGESWPVNNQIFISYDDGDPLTGIASFFDSVLIFKEHSVWRITGIPPDIKIEPLHFRQDQTATGCLSQRLILVDHDEVIYRGSDAIYELNRFEGQAEGFKSQRLSLPIDELVQAGFNNAIEAPVAHAVYYRYKRQARFWETTRRALVLQFESTVEGEPFGWMKWIADVPTVPGMPTSPAGPRCSCISRYDSTVVRGVTSPLMPGSMVDAVNFVAIDGGIIVQLDIGTADYGCGLYEVQIAPLRFSPATRGVPARGRAIDWQVQQVNGTTAGIEVLTDWMTSKVSTPLILVDGLNTFAPAQIDLIGMPVPAFDTLATLIIAPGHHHEFFWRESDLASYYRIQGWTYWFQPLSKKAVWRKAKQTTPAPIITTPTP